jgi:hypothetical protein
MKLHFQDLCGAVVANCGDHRRVDAFSADHAKNEDASKDSLFQIRAFVSARAHRTASHRRRTPAPHRRQSFRARSDCGQTLNEPRKPLAA